MQRRRLLAGGLSAVLLAGGIAVAACSDPGNDDSPASASPAAQGALSDADLDALAIRLIAEHEDVAESELSILNRVLASYPLSGRSAHGYKVYSAASRQQYTIYLDDAGNELDGHELSEAERAAYAARFGKLSSDLRAKLESASSGERFLVTVGAKVDSNGATSDSELQRLNEETARALADRVGRLGYDVDETVFSLGSFRVEMTAAHIDEVAAWPEVAGIALVALPSPAAGRG